MSAPLIANVRGHFAEFLNQRSPERLSMLYSPTCVSFSTVLLSLTYKSFSWTIISRLRSTISSSRNGDFQRPDRPLIAVTKQKLKKAKECSPYIHRLRSSASTKGPADPGRIYLPQETLGLRRTGFSPVLSLLIPA